MSEIRRDLVKQNWVAVASDRALKPNDFPIAKRDLGKVAAGGFCPFCEGNESFTPPEVAVYRPEDTEANSGGWSIRTIPNKFSAFELQGQLVESQKGVYKTYNGLGKHEVVIETPEHGVEFHEFDQERVYKILTMLKQRYNDLARDERIKYIQIYKNRGMFGGASLEHSHSQIVALPFVPRENEGLPQYYASKGTCLICDMVQQECTEKERVIWETEDFVLICPYASRFSYEAWIIPRRHTEHFGQINEQEMDSLAHILLTYTRAMIDCLQDPSYNFVINTAPVNVDHQSGYHWYIEVTPRLLVQAAVEVATGIYINPVAPEISAQMLKESLSKLI